MTNERNVPCRGRVHPDGTHEVCPEDASVTVLVAKLFGQEWASPAICPACREVEEATVLAQSRKEWRADAEKALELPSTMREWTLASYPSDTAGRAATAEAEAWITAFDRGDAGNLYLWGPVGGGKTGLAVGIARALQERHVLAARPLHDWEDRRPTPPVAFVNWRSLLARIRDGFGEGGKHERTERVSAYFGVPVLVVDDLGAERPTEWALEELATLIDARHGRGLPAIITSNYELPDLGRRFGRDDPVVGLRIVSRISQDARVVQVKAPRDRRRNVRRDRETS